MTGRKAGHPLAEDGIHGRIGWQQEGATGPEGRKDDQQGPEPGEAWAAASKNRHKIPHTAGRRFSSS
jgi:hypothetical protein